MNIIRCYNFKCLKKLLLGKVLNSNDTKYETLKYHFNMKLFLKICVLPINGIILALYKTTNETNYSVYETKL